MRWSFRIVSAEDRQPADRRQSPDHWGACPAECHAVLSVAELLQGTGGIFVLPQLEWSGRTPATARPAFLANTQNRRGEPLRFGERRPQLLFPLARSHCETMSLTQSNRTAYPYHSAIEGCMSTPVSHQSIGSLELADGPTNAEESCAEARPTCIDAHLASGLGIEPQDVFST